MAIYGNMVGSSGGILGKTVEIISDDGVDLMGVVTDQETVLTASPNDIRKGKIAATEYGIIEGEKDIPAYRTTMAYRLILPNENFSISLPGYNQYDYTKIQCIIALYSSDYSTNAKIKYVSINDSIYSTESSDKLSDITKNSDTKSIDLNITNNSEDTYLIFYFTYREEE